MNDVSFVDVIRIYRSLEEDGSLEKPDAIILLKILKETLEKIRPHIKRAWLFVALSGIEKIIEETIEHLEELENEE